MLVISCYIMVLFLFFGTYLFCYSYLHLLFKYNNRGEIYQSYKAEVNID